MKRTPALSLFFTLLIAQAAFASSTITAVHTFVCTGTQGASCPQGEGPGSLIQGSDGNFYGTASASTLNFPQNGGTVFSLTPAGKLTVLHSFNNLQQGNFPGFLAEGPDGNLYGITFSGGGSGNHGVVYRVSKQGFGFKVIHQFCATSSCTDGVGGTNLVVGRDGNLYGTSTFGGTGFCQGGCGVIYRVVPSSSTYEVVFNFNGTTDGAFPSGLTVAPDGSFVGLGGAVLFHYSPVTGAFSANVVNIPFNNGHPTQLLTLTFGPNGNLYGPYNEYAKQGAGVFEIKTDGTGLHLFPFYTTNSASPLGAVVASDGNLWIADAIAGGTGEILKISPSTGNVLQTIKPFGPSARVGSNPSSFIQALNGTFWGTTFFNGIAAAGDTAGGVVFKLNAGLPPR